MTLKTYKLILLKSCLVYSLLSIQACQKGINWDEPIVKNLVIKETPATDTMAAFTLIKTGSRCTLVNVKGTYTSGIPLNNSNEAQFDVNVTRKGPYMINTATANGISFVATGSFSATGKQSITIKGTGTPINLETTTIVISDGSTTCSFTLRVL